MQGAKAETGKGRICAHSHMQMGTGGVRLRGEGQRKVRKAEAGWGPECCPNEEVWISLSSNGKY